MNHPSPDEGRVPVPVAVLARFLYTEAGQDSARTREALAATIVNQVRRLHSAETNECSRLATAPRGVIASLIVDAVARVRTLEEASPRSDDPLFTSCCRIAKRAITGALHDPTAGAVRFQKVGESPDDGPDAGSQAWIGSYLFYTDEKRSAPAPPDSAEAMDAEDR